jgi:hypothetical protein
MKLSKLFVLLLIGCLVLGIVGAGEEDNTKAGDKDIKEEEGPEKKPDDKKEDGKEESEKKPDEKPEEPTAMPACKDISSECKKIKRYCKNKAMMSVVLTNCPGINHFFEFLSNIEKIILETCGLCKAKCRDMTKACKSWKKNGFCTSVLYMEGVKRYSCKSEIFILFLNVRF